VIYLLNFPLNPSIRLYIFSNVFRYCILIEKQLILICCIPDINSLLLVMVQASSHEIGKDCLVQEKIFVIIVID